MRHIRCLTSHNTQGMNNVLMIVLALSRHLSVSLPREMASIGMSGGSVSIVVRVSPLFRKWLISATTDGIQNKVLTRTVFRLANPLRTADCFWSLHLSPHHSHENYLVRSKLAVRMRSRESNNGMRRARYRFGLVSRDRSALSNQTQPPQVREPAA